MTGRPSVNKRQRELVRKERQADKLLRRDERRNKRNLDPVLLPAPEPGVPDESVGGVPELPPTTK